MPDYRKKRIGFKKKNNKKTSKIDDNIKMESNDSKQKRFPKSNIKVEKGKSWNESGDLKFMEPLHSF